MATFEQFKQNVNNRIGELFTENISNHDKMIEITGLTAEPINGKVGGQSITKSLDQIEVQLNANTESNNVIDFTNHFDVDLSGCSALTIKELVEGLAHYIVDKSK